MAKHTTTIDLALEDHASDPAERAAKRISGALKQMHAEARQSGELNLERILSSPQGLIGAGFEAAGMGLSAIIAEKIGEGIKEASAKAVEMDDALREGKANAADFANELAKSVPILGGFVEGFENIIELSTHEKRNIAEQNELVKLTNEFYDHQAEAIRQAHEAQRAQLVTIERIHAEMLLIGMVGSARSITEANQAHESVVQQQNDVLAKFKEAQPSDQKDRADLSALRMKQMQEEADLRERMAYLQQNIHANTGFPRELAAAKKRLAELTGAEQVLVDKIAGIDKINADKRQAAQKTHDDTIATDAAKTAQLIAQIQKDSNYQMEQEQYEHETRLHQTVVQGVKALAEAQGYGEEFARQALEDSRQKELSDAQVRHDKLVHDNAGNDKAVAQANLELQQDQSAINDRYGRQQQALAIKQAQDQNKATFDMREAVLDMQAQAQAKSLRLMGQGADAEIDLIRRQGEKRIAAIREQADREAATHQELAPQIHAKADADVQAATMDTDEQVRQARESRRQKDISTNESLIGGQIAGLEQQAKAGDIIAAQEAKRLKIQDEFNQKRAEYQKIIRDQDSSAQQRAAAGALLGGLDSQEKLALASMNAFGIGREQAATISARGTGTASKQREEAAMSQARELAKARAEAKQSADRTNLLLEQIHAALTQDVNEPILQNVR